jgi:hypothetical protein
LRAQTERAANAAATKLGIGSPTGGLKERRKSLSGGSLLASPGRVSPNALASPGGCSGEDQGHAFTESAAKCTVVAEVLDGRTKELMSASLSDPVLSNDLVSMSLAMVAENR